MEMGKTCKEKASKATNVPKPESSTFFKFVHIDLIFGYRRVDIECPKATPQHHDFFAVMFCVV